MDGKPKLLRAERPTRPTWEELDKTIEQLAQAVKRIKDLELMREYDREEIERLKKELENGIPNPDQ